MFVYKKLKASDIALVPFNAHKNFKLSWTGSNISYSVGIDGLNTSNPIPTYPHATFNHAAYSQSTIEGFRKPQLIHRQLEQLYYGSNDESSTYPNRIGGIFGDVDFYHQKRELTNTSAVISIPQDFYGYEIKPNTFHYTQSVGDSDIDLWTSFMYQEGPDKATTMSGYIPPIFVKDDGKGNLVDTIVSQSKFGQIYFSSNTLSSSYNAQRITKGINPYFNYNSEITLLQEDYQYQSTSPSSSDDLQISASVLDEFPTIKYMYRSQGFSQFVDPAFMMRADLERLNDPKLKVFHLSPKNGHKLTNLHRDKYGMPLVNIYENIPHCLDGFYDQIDCGNPPIVQPGMDKAGVILK